MNTSERELNFIDSKEYSEFKLNRNVVIRGFLKGDLLTHECVLLFRLLACLRSNCRPIGSSGHRLVSSAISPVHVFGPGLSTRMRRFVA